MRTSRWISVAALSLLACGGGGDSSVSTGTNTPTTPTGPTTPSTPKVATVTVNVAGGAAPTLAVGGTLSLTATAADSLKNVVSGSVFTWSSSNTGVATVSSTGAVTAVGSGTVTITATTQGIGGSIVIIVAQSSTQPVLTIRFVGDSTVMSAFGGASSATLRITRTNFTGPVSVTTNITGALTATNSTITTSADSVQIPFTALAGTCGATTLGGGSIGVTASAAGVTDQRSSFKVVVPNPTGTIQASVKPDTVVLTAGVTGSATVTAQTDSPPASLGDFSVTGVTTGFTMSGPGFTETRGATAAFDTAKVSLFATTAIPSGFYSAHVPVTAACSKRTLESIANFTIRVVNNP